ncbi:MAG: response regulator [Chloroflexota bacterium]|nr:response regulator [Chloroflexota bacterium]
MARIVFCEDEGQIRKLIEAAMRATTHTIEMTVNGRDGLAAIEREMPELIVTDLAMPVMGGFALADAVKAQPSLHHIPIVFVTASVQRGDVARFGEHGAAGYLAKPFSPRELRAKIDELILHASSVPGRG